eukprot:5099377-Prorocentrum_lima.AAC.1
MAPPATKNIPLPPMPPTPPVVWQGPQATKVLAAQPPKAPLMTSPPMPERAMSEPPSTGGTAAGLG